MSTQTPEKYIRTTVEVDAIQVTAENLDQIAAWCGGRVMAQRATEEHSARYYVKVPVKNPLKRRLGMAFENDWVLHLEGSGFKVFTPKAFEAGFEKKAEEVDI